MYLHDIILNTVAIESPFFHESLPPAKGKVILGIGRVISWNSGDSLFTVAVPAASAVQCDFLR